MAPAALNEGKNNREVGKTGRALKVREALGEAKSPRELPETSSDADGITATVSSCRTPVTTAVTAAS